MGGYENLIGQYNRRSDLALAQDQRRQASIASLLGSLGQGATAYMDQSKLKALADSMEQPATPTGTDPSSQYGTMETAMGGGAIGDDDPADDDEGPSMPQMPGVSAPPGNPAITPYSSAPQMPSAPPGAMAPPAAPPQAMSRPPAAKPVAPPPMPQSRRPNYGALAGMSPAALDRAKLMLSGYERENSLSSREATAGMRESGLSDRAAQMDARMREIEMMRSGDRRYGVDTRTETTERGQDLNYELGGRRIATTERGQDIGKELGEGRIQMGRDIAGMRDTTTRRGQDIGNENADATRTQQGDQFDRKLAVTKQANADRTRIAEMTVDLRKEIEAARAAEAAGKAQAGEADRVVRSYAPTLAAIERVIAKARTDDPENEAIPALEAQAAEFKKLLAAPPPAQGGNVEATKRKIKDLLR